MELEQRVKTLEYEFKILKNEIQRTLLDIQEQVLIHYYPTLRAEENEPSTGAVQALEAIRTKQNTSAPGAVPVAKKVSLDQVREAQGDNPPAIIIEPTAPVPPSAKAETPLAPASTGKVFQWGINTAAKFGGARVKKLIEAYSAKGVFAPEIKDTLVQIAALNQDAGPEKVAINDLLRELMRLNELLGRVTDAEEALAIIEEAKLG